MHLSDAAASPGPPALDLWLRFSPEVDARYEAKHAGERLKHLRHVIHVGLLLYNSYAVSDLFLMPDVAWIAIPLRILLVSPACFLIARHLWRVSSASREHVILFALVIAFLFPLGFSWFSQAALSSYTFAEFTLILVFGNMLFPLRFRHAVAFTGLCGAAGIAAIATKSALGLTLEAALLLQLATACLFTLYANFHIERRRCRDHLGIVAAERRAETARSLTKRFEDLSVTDPLTGLPNRRVLDRRVDEGLADGGLTAVLMIDVDHFKLFNDTLGHPAGDDCLRTVAQATFRSV